MSRPRSISREALLGRLRPEHARRRRRPGWTHAAPLRNPEVRRVEASRRGVLAQRLSETRVLNLQGSSISGLGEGNRGPTKGPLDRYVRVQPRSARGPTLAPLRPPSEQILQKGLRAVKGLSPLVLTHWEALPYWARELTLMGVMSLGAYLLVGHEAGLLVAAAPPFLGRAPHPITTIEGAIQLFETERDETSVREVMTYVRRHLGIAENEALEDNPKLLDLASSLVGPAPQLAGHLLHTYGANTVETRWIRAAGHFYQDPSQSIVREGFNSARLAYERSITDPHSTPIERLTTTLAYANAAFESKKNHARLARGLYRDAKNLALEMLSSGCPPEDTHLHLIAARLAWLQQTERNGLRKALAELTLVENRMPNDLMHPDVATFYIIRARLQLLAYLVQQNRPHTTTPVDPSTIMPDLKRGIAVLDQLLTRGHPDLKYSEVASLTISTLQGLQSASQKIQNTDEILLAIYPLVIEATIALFGPQHYQVSALADSYLSNVNRISLRDAPNTGPQDSVPTRDPIEWLQKNLLNTRPTLVPASTPQREHLTKKIGEMDSILALDDENFDSLFYASVRQIQAHLYLALGELRQALPLYRDTYNTVHSLQGVDGKWPLYLLDRMRHIYFSLGDEGPHYRLTLRLCQEAAQRLGLQHPYTRTLVEEVDLLFQQRGTPLLARAQFFGRIGAVEKTRPLIISSIQEKPDDLTALDLAEQTQLVLPANLCQSSRETWLQIVRDLSPADKELNTLAYVLNQLIEIDPQTTDPEVIIWLAYTLARLNVVRASPEGVINARSYLDMLSATPLDDSINTIYILADAMVTLAEEKDVATVQAILDRAPSGDKDQLPYVMSQLHVLAKQWQGLEKNLLPTDPTYPFLADAFLTWVERVVAIAENSTNTGRHDYLDAARLWGIRVNKKIGNEEASMAFALILISTTLNEATAGLALMLATQDNEASTRILVPIFVSRFPRFGAH